MNVGDEIKPEKYCASLKRWSCSTKLNRKLEDASWKFWLITLPCWVRSAFVPGRSFLIKKSARLHPGIPSGPFTTHFICLKRYWSLTVARSLFVLSVPVRKWVFVWWQYTALLTESLHVRFCRRSRVSDLQAVIHIWTFPHHGCSGNHQCWRNTSGIWFFPRIQNSARSVPNTVKFIGATPEQIDQMGDKSNAKDTMKRAGVPTIPGSDGLLSDLKPDWKSPNQVGYPVILKATAGGGGKECASCGNRKTLSWHGNPHVREAGAAFGNDGMYLENTSKNHDISKFKSPVISMAKPAIQWTGLFHSTKTPKAHGRNSSPFATNELREKMGEAAIAAALAVKYEGVGTVEFLVDKHRNFISWKWIPDSGRASDHGRSDQLRPDQGAN